MKKILTLAILLVIFTTGCSYQITSGSTQLFQGENKDWKVEYQMDSTTTYPEKNGQTYVRRTEEGKLTIEWKKDLTYLSDVKHMEISYEDSFGNGGKRIVRDKIII